MLRKNLGGFLQQVSLCLPAGGPPFPLFLQVFYTRLCSNFKLPLVEVERAATRGGLKRQDGLPIGERRR